MFLGELLLRFLPQHKDQQIVVPPLVPKNLDHVPTGTYFLESVGPWYSSGLGERKKSLYGYTIKISGQTTVGTKLNHGRYYLDELILTSSHEAGLPRVVSEVAHRTHILLPEGKIYFAGHMYRMDANNIRATRFMGQVFPDNAQVTRIS